MKKYIILSLVALLYGQFSFSMTEYEKEDQERQERIERDAKSKDFWNAILADDGNVLKDFLDKKPDTDVNIPFRPIESSALHYLAGGKNTDWGRNYGNVKKAILLFDKGANVDARNVLGETPLHEAIRTRDIPFIRLLLLHNADLALKTRGAQLTPLMLAEKIRAIGEGETLEKEIIVDLLKNAANRKR